VLSSKCSNRTCLMRSQALVILGLLSR
jgi:hypothetical protein